MTYRLPNGFTITIFRTWDGAWFQTRNESDEVISFTHIGDSTRSLDMIAAIEKNSL